MRVKPDCQICGACCMAFEEGPFCDLTGKDIARLTPATRKQMASLYPGAWAFEASYRPQRRGKFKGYELLVCQLLRGSVMCRVSCRIYARRPTACREAVKPGDRTCRYLRRVVSEYLTEA